MGMGRDRGAVCGEEVDGIRLIGMEILLIE
jgi:hypothetical protein